MPCFYFNKKGFKMSNFKQRSCVMTKSICDDCSERKSCKALGVGWAKDSKQRALEVRLRESQCIQDRKVVEGGSKTASSGEGRVM